MFISSYVLHNNKCKSIGTEHPNIYSKNNAKNFGDGLRVFRFVAFLTGFPAPLGRRFYQYCMPGGIYYDPRIPYRLYMQPKSRSDVTLVAKPYMQGVIKCPWACNNKSRSAFGGAAGAMFWLLHP